MSLAERTVVGHLEHDEQMWLVEDVRQVLKDAPLVRPRTPNGLPMRVRVSAAGKYGWVGDGAYRYDEKQKSGKPWPSMPLRWRHIADKFAGPHDWDCAIINWYEEGASLGWHQDLAERDRRLPIVTISLGDACSWAIRKDEHSSVSRTRLESGDVTALAEETRMYFHTIERIIAAPLFSPLKVRGRISITIRVAG